MSDKMLRNGHAATVPRKQQKPIFGIATTQLDAIAAKQTAKCLTGAQWAYRDKDFDAWLPATQPASDACVITTLVLTKVWTFAQAAAELTGLPADTEPKVLGQALIERGYTMTLAQAEAMVEATERNEETDDGRGNFFFVETGNENDPVSVAGVYRGDVRWSAHVSRLGHGGRWCAGPRLLVRNLDASKL